MEENRLSRFRNTLAHGTPLNFIYHFRHTFIIYFIQNKTYHVFLLAECFPDQFLFQARYLTVPIIACINFATNG